VLVPGIRGVRGVRRGIGRARDCRARIRDHGERFADALREASPIKTRELGPSHVELLCAFGDPRRDHIGVGEAQRFDHVVEVYGGSEGGAGALARQLVLPGSGGDVGG